MQIYLLCYMMLCYVILSSRVQGVQEFMGMPSPIHHSVAPSAAPAPAVSKR